MSSLKDRITEDSKNALRSGDKARLGALRLILAAVKQQEVDSRKELDDRAVESLIAKLVKKGRDAAEQFAQAGRTDLADKENFEVAVFEEFLPTPLTEAQAAAAVAAAIEATGAHGPGDMGKVMAHLKATLGGADLGALSALVRAALSGS